MLIVDPLSPPGHICFNKYFCSYLPIKKMCFYLSSDRIYLFNKLENIIPYPAINFKNKNRIAYFFIQCYILIKIIFISKKIKKNEILFLSYELPSMMILSHLFALFNIKLFVLEHNTFKPDSIVRKQMFLLMNKKVIHICLAPYIEKKIKSYNIKTIFTWHPINENIKAGHNLKNIFFMPSSTIPNELIKPILNSFETTKRHKLFYKSKHEYISEFVISKPFFDNYEDLIANSEGVLIPQKFNYRLSGVFFDALPGTSYIYMSDCMFSREMFKIFPKRIIILKDWIDFLKNIQKIGIKNCNINPIKWNENANNLFKSNFY